MGNKPRIEIKDLQVGSEYWVSNGNWSFKVMSIHDDRVVVSYIHGTMLIPFSDTDLVIEEYN